MKFYFVRLLRVESELLRYLTIKLNIFWASCFELRIIIRIITQTDCECRMCGIVDESINHELRECSKLVQKSISADLTLWVKECIGMSAKSVDLRSKTNDMSMSLKLSW